MLCLPELVDGQLDLLLGRPGDLHVGDHLLERVPDGPDVGLGRHEVRAKIPDQVEVEPVPQSARPRRLPLVPGHLLNARRHTGRLELDHPVHRLRQARVQRQDVETRPVWHNTELPLKPGDGRVEQV